MQYDQYSSIIFSIHYVLLLNYTYFTPRIHHNTVRHIPPIILSRITKECKSVSTSDHVPALPKLKRKSRTTKLTSRYASSSLSEGLALTTNNLPSPPTCRSVTPSSSTFLPTLLDCVRPTGCWYFCSGTGLPLLVSSIESDDDLVSVGVSAGVIARTLCALALGDVLDVVVFVLMLSLVERALVVVSKKLGPEMKGSISSSSSTSLAERRGCNWRGWAGKYCPASYEL